LIYKQRLVKVSSITFYLKSRDRFLSEDGGV